MLFDNSTHRSKLAHFDHISIVTIVKVSVVVDQMGNLHLVLGIVLQPIPCKAVVGEGDVGVLRLL